MKWQIVANVVKDKDAKLAVAVHAAVVVVAAIPNKGTAVLVQPQSMRKETSAKNKHRNPEVVNKSIFDSLNW